MGIDGKKRHFWCRLQISIATSSSHSLPASSFAQSVNIMIHYIPTINFQSVSTNHPSSSNKPSKTQKRDFLDAISTWYWSWSTYSYFSKASFGKWQASEKSYSAGRFQANWAPDSRALGLNCPPWKQLCPGQLGIRDYTRSQFTRNMQESTLESRGHHIARRRPLLYFLSRRYSQLISREVWTEWLNSLANGPPPASHLNPHPFANPPNRANSQK